MNPCLKALAMPAQRTKLHAQNPPKGGKRTTPQSCLLTSSHVGAVSQTPIHTHITHTQIIIIIIIIFK